MSVPLYVSGELYLVEPMCEDRMPTNIMAGPHPDDRMCGAHSVHTNISTHLHNALYGNVVN